MRVNLRGYNPWMVVRVSDMIKDKTKPYISFLFEMEWNTIPVELLERILVFTKSPYAVGNALMTCKNWNEVEHDPHLWQVK